MLALFILLLGFFALLFDVPIFTGLFRLVGLWPLLLIGLGLWVIFKTVNQEKVGTVLLALILVGAMYSVFSRPALHLESLEEKTVLPGITSVDVSMDLALGAYYIGSTPESLFTAKGYPIMEPHLYTDGATAHLDFSLREEAFIPPGDLGNEYHILLNQHLPLTISGGIGVASCSLDLSTLNVKELYLDGGLCSLEITCGETDTRVALSMGLSSVRIYVPQSVGVRIDSEGLVSLQVPSGWIKTENGYKSPNYDTAQHRIDITSDMGIGSIIISYAKI